MAKRIPLILLLSAIVLSSMAQNTEAMISPTTCINALSADIYDNSGKIINEYANSDCYASKEDGIIDQVITPYPEPTLAVSPGASRINDDDDPLAKSSPVVIENNDNTSTTPSLSNDDDIPQAHSAPITVKKVVKAGPVEKYRLVIIPILPPENILDRNDSSARNTRRVDLTLYGTPMSVRVPFSLGKAPILKNVSEKDVANALMALSDEANNITLADCLNLREKHQLCDWAYLQLLNTLASEVTDSQNDARLLTAYLFLQSGYKVRLATIGDDFYMLFACTHFIYNKQYYEVDGYNYYCLDRMPSQLYISNTTLTQDTPLSLDIPKTPKLEVVESEPVTHTSAKYPFFTTTTTVNKNLLDFYSSYPSASVNKDEVTRWVAKANTPMDSALSEQLYPTIRQLLEGKSRHESLSILLDYVQTGFEYRSDNNVWGSDRAFFPEETMYYPYSDCEDRAILLTRLVSDVLGYDCLLLYYPGHMACAIEMEDNSIEGDYVTLDGKYYIVADPTFINAKLGKSMPTMDITKAQVIKLEKRSR